MLLKEKNIKLVNEILYILKTLDDIGMNSVSKIGLQNIVYSSKILSPVKDIILSSIRYISWNRGPYSSELQNTLDQMVALGFIDVKDFNSQDKCSFANYCINKSGRQIIKALISYKKEEETFWWLSVVTKSTYLYSKEDLYDKKTGYQGFDTIVNLIYQDPTYKYLQKKSLIDFEDKRLPTNNLIKFVKEYIEANKNTLNLKNERYTAEIIIIAYFEFLYSQLLDNDIFK